MHMLLLVLAALALTPGVNCLAFPTSFSRRTVLDTLATGGGALALGVGAPGRAGAAATAAAGRVGGATVPLAAQALGKASAGQVFPLASFGLQVRRRQASEPTSSYEAFAHEATCTRWES
jgi:hypothetical protein